MNLPKHAINWFELPVSNFNRAKRFYEMLFDYTMATSDIGTSKMGFLLFDFENGGKGGAIVYNPEFYTPSANGTLVYLNAEPDLQILLNKVEAAGGRILTQKKLVAPDAHLGYWATILDTEGNRVALHSNS
jgi:predicted enzyme related to lactoylglutathione lyase